MPDLDGWEGQVRYDVEGEVRYGPRVFPIQVQRKFGGIGYVVIVCEVIKGNWLRLTEMPVPEVNQGRAFGAGVEFVLGYCGNERGI
jgi:hypothetical protein